MRLSPLRLAIALPLVALGGLLLHTAWPFLFYDKVTLAFSTPAKAQAVLPRTAIAGIAETDITPPMAIPKFGYSAWAKSSNGFRTRLKARAFYLQGANQPPLAIVQLDLGSGSLPLHLRVAELIEHTGVPAHRLSLLASHTHSGPGQYLGSNFYNVFGSNKPGFDPRLFEFLSQQIADAVIAAYQNRREARFATGQADIHGVTRNRSIQAWAQNHPGLTNPDPFQAINPTMTMLRIDQRHGDTFIPAGALSLYSIHGTAIPAFTAPYHADVWHWISQQLEMAMISENPDFIHASAEATHADNNPAWKHDHRGDREAQRIGTALGNHAIDLFQQLQPGLTPTLNTAFASRQLNLLDRTQTARFGLCERGIAGAAVAGAANGDEVFPISWLPFLQEGWPRRIFTDHCQGAKQWMASKLQLLLDAQQFPNRALFQVIRINDLVLVPLPWEITLESGNRLRQAIRETLPAGSPWQIEISSLANGYFGYAVTPEEYQLQYYEGGHTLYGPHTLDFLIAHSSNLSRELMTQGDIADLPERQQFTLLSKHYMPVVQTDSYHPRSWLPGISQHHSTLAGDYWQATLIAEPPGQLALNQPLLSVQCDSGYRVSDESGQLQILDTGQSHPQGHRYQVRWFAPDQRDTQGCRLAVIQSANPVKNSLSDPID